MVGRWLSRLPETAADEIRQAGWDKSLRDALSDPDKGGLEAPNGPLVEIAERWSKGSPLYDPKEIQVPVCVIVGTNDTETPPANVRRLYAELTDHPAALYVEIAGASHFVPIEPKRQRIVEFASTFLA
jgi:pimeloyl-ACP methyl ester carboxylesterase